MNSPTITLHPASPDPARKQIADQIRSAIVEGSLRPGDELPSVRRLGIDLGVHFNTIAEAYRNLAGEGWLDISQGRGARVLARPATEPSDPHLDDEFRRRLRTLTTDMRAAGISIPRVRELLLTALEGIQ